jgi:hypothetical protein
LNYWAVQDKGVQKFSKERYKDDENINPISVPGLEKHRSLQEDQIRELYFQDG